MEEDVQKFKAESYDIMVKLESLQTEIEELKKKKETLTIKITTLIKNAEQREEGKKRKPAGSAVIQEVTDETRMKEQKIIQKRLTRTTGVKEEPNEDG